MAKPIRVLTLNAWGIALPWPFGSTDRRVRISAIADELATGKYDIVALQEIWSVSDYETIRKRVDKVLPDAFYFHSGMIGSGVCVFTKGKIYATLMHRYSLNGYPHHVHRGDWFGGKVVGLARIKLNDLKIDFYATHLHAEYNKDNDLYLPHRVLQSFELSQFVNGTSTGEVTIIVGDLNLESDDFGYKLIVSSACLEDAYENYLHSDAYDKESDSHEGATCDVPTNCYTHESTLQRWPHGKRIDYILYRSKDNHSVVSRQCVPTLGRISTLPTLNFSDHEGVYAELDVTSSYKKTESKGEKYSDEIQIGVDIDINIGVEKKRELVKCEKFSDKAINLIQIGIDASVSTRRWCAAILPILLVLFVITINIEVAYEVPAFTLAALAARFVLTLLIGFIFIYGLVGLKMEQKALEAAKAGMLVLKKADE